MTLIQHAHDNDRRRPFWLPHPSLLAVIALLWVLAAAVDAVTLLGR
ncbi:MAG TPA: hypothetical protein VII56_08820 [Rhizomicrobium sp.]